MPVKRQVWCVPIGSADAGAPVGFFYFAGDDAFTRAGNSTIVPVCYLMMSACVVRGASEILGGGGGGSPRDADAGRQRLHFLKEESAVGICIHMNASSE